ncbi:MAG: transporter substrate-binding domain-containing protein [Clostridia bacterium]|nr:transporter substrate-binding domain-containing protein [Clostridia bacterium]
MKKKIILICSLVLVCVLCASIFVACNNNNQKKVSIGVQAGTTGEAYVKGDVDWGFAGIPNTTVSSYDTIALAVNDIKNGSINYAVVDKAVAENLVEANSNDIKMIDINLTVEKYAIGVNKNKTELLSQINTIIANLKSDGTLDAIYEAYADIDINDDGDQGSAPNSDVYTGVVNGNPNAQNKLTLATNAQFAPYEYKIGTKFYGIDMEIAKIIAEELDLELVISDMEFASVVTSVQQGDCDIALSCLTVNAKREKSVTFTTAYEEGAAQVLIVKKSDTAFDNCKTVDDVLNVFKNIK